MEIACKSIAVNPIRFVFSYFINYVRIVGLIKIFALSVFSKSNLNTLKTMIISPELELYYRRSFT